MKLNTKQTVLIGLSFASILAFWEFYDQVIPSILESHFGLGTIVTNSIMAIDNILAVFMLPLFGVISDKTNSWLGKRTPYIFIGTLAAVIVMLSCAYVTETKNVIAFFILLMILLVTMSVYRSPAVAYMPDVTPKPLRSKGNAVINLVGYIGGIFAMLATMLLVKNKVDNNGDPIKDADGNLIYESFIPIFIAIGIFMFICVVVMVLSLNENKLEHVKEEKEATPQNAGKKLPKDVLKSLIFILVSVFLWFCAYNGVTTSFARYFEEIFYLNAGDSSIYIIVATGAAIISFVPLGIVSSKLGRKKTILTGISLMTVCYFAFIFVNKSIVDNASIVVFIIFALVGVGWAAINVNSFPMIVEMCSDSDLGKYTGYYYAFSMSAQIATPLLSGLIIDENLIGLGYGALFPYAVVFSVLSFVTMLFVKHGDSKPVAKKNLLENFDVDD